MSIKKLRKGKRNTLSPFQKELVLQCIKYVKNSPEGFRSIPLGYNLEEDIGLITEAEQVLRNNMTYDEHIDCDNQLCEAVDKIIQLQAELEKHRWMPVSERLPEEGQEVLLCNADKVIMLVGVWTKWCNKGLNHTHWKPIIPPKKD